MATLEKIRSKSVFLIVVIGVALLAFIVGDALTNSRNIFGDHTTVAKVGSKKIDYTDYQRKREELNAQLEQARKQNPEQFANFDTQVLAQMAVEQLVQERLMLDAADKAGIRATGNLLRFYMLENPGNPEVMKVLQQLNASGLAVQSPQQAYEVIFNPKKNGLTDAQVEPFQRAWLAAENRTKDMAKMMVYQRLLMGTVHANDLDRQALHNDYVTTANVDVAFKPFGTLSEKEFPVSDAEIKARYDKDKAMWRVEEPTREISFIAVNVAPSQADQTQSKALAQKTVAALAAGGQLPKELKKEGVSLMRHSMRASDIQNPAIKEYVTSGGDSVRLISNDIRGFTAVRLLGTSSQVDSIQVNVVSAASEALGRKVMASLNSGLPADSVMKTFSADSVNTQLKQWLPLYTADGPSNVLPKETLDSLINAGGKYISIQAGPQGMVMAQVVEKKAPVTIYEYDEATYQLVPSQKTRTDDRAKLEKFLGANNTAAKFNANAAKAGYNVQKFTINASTPAVPRVAGVDQYFPDSRQVVRWVMIDGEVGQVSHIYSSQDASNPMLYAVAIDEAYDEYVPVTNKFVRETITRLVRNDKAGEKWAAQYRKNASSVNAAAKAMGVQAQNLPAVRFGINQGVGDPSVAARMLSGKADKKVKVVPGSDGVYVYTVNGLKKENFQFNEQMYDQQYMQMLNPNLVKMIQGTQRIVNNVYKFEAGE